ncbi:MAG: cobalt ECF transporter T component CbiQ [Eubacteriales bacterium]
MNISNIIYEIRHLDEISQQDTFIHRLNPLSKLLVSFFYITITVSFNKYDILGLIPLIFYPIMIMTIGNIPYKPIFKRTLLVLPFVIGIGLFNPLLDKSIVTYIMGFPITGGWISFISLIIKCFLTVMCGLILISTTGIEGIASALRRLKVPKLFVLQILLTYRYISVLIQEASNIWLAYSLRAPGQKGVQSKVWGSLLGQLLIRTYDRGDRVYQAMVLRGFQGEYPHYSKMNPSLTDMFYTLSWVCFIALTRMYNLPNLLGSFMIGG